jgi:putative ABC transport system permease protein
MKALSSLRTFLGFVFHRFQVEREMEAELRAHLESRADELERQGLPRVEAERQARLEFGGYERYKEECREALGSRLLGELVADTRYALRQLRRNPGFTAVAVLTLALGIGANTAIFSLANAVFFRGFPFPNADRLAFLWQDNARTGETEGAVSYPNYADWRAQSHTFEDMAFISFGKNFLTGGGTMTTLSGAGGPEQVSTATVSTNFFTVFSVKPILGRGFLPEDSTEGHTSVLVISYGLWQERFGGDRQIVGRSVKIWGGNENVIIGVLPRGFTFPNKAQIWKPRAVNAFLQTKARQYPNLSVIGKRNAGVTWQQAQAEMSTIAARLATAYPSVDGGVGVRIVPLRQELSARVRQGIVILWAAIFGVLLIACLNTASLLIGRAAGRQKEIAVRLSLGATRRRLGRQLLTESLSLALAGGLVGVGLALVIVNLASKLNPDLARLEGALADFRVLGYTAAVVGIAALLCGLLPGLIVPGIDLNRALEGNAAAASPATHLTRKTLLVTEVAMAFVLLVGSALLMRSLWGILRIDPGFDAGHVLAFHVYWPGEAKTLEESSARRALSVDLIRRLRSLPAVASVATASFVLFPDEMFKVPFKLEDEIAQPSDQNPLLTAGEVSPDYFRTMGIPLLRGRVFSPSDATKDPPTVGIIDETMARRYWPNQDPLGKRFEFVDPNFKSAWFTIVGIVGDVRGQGLERPRGLMAYIPSDDDMNDDIVMRTKGDPIALGAAVRHEIRQLNKNLLVDHMNTARTMLLERESHRQFTAWLLGSFAFVAVVLAAVGIYGVLAYWVAQRTKEIGVRMALGATRSSILGLVMRDLVAVLAGGLAAGILISLAATRVLQQILFGLGPRDTATMLLAAGVLSAVALLAGYLPARRATKVDPMVALRYE